MELELLDAAYKVEVMDMKNSQDPGGNLLSMVQGFGDDPEEGDDQIEIDLSQNQDLKVFLNKYIQERSATYNDNEEE